MTPCMGDDRLLREFSDSANKIQEDFATETTSDMEDGMSKSRIGVDRKRVSDSESGLSGQ